MKKKLFRNDGFTLVELLITILVGSLVTLAATTILLLGLRFNQVSTGAAKSQNTTRILLTVLENLASEGAIKKVDSGADSWVISGTDKDLLSYDSESQTIYSGGIPGDDDATADGTPLLEGVVASHVSRDETRKLLTVSVETAEGIFSSTIYCRTSVEYISPADPPEDGLVNNSGREMFVNVLMGQYKMAGGQVNPGLILDENGMSTGEYKYYSEWYIKGYQGKEGWNEKTPWCACFVSWAIDKVRTELNTPIIEANVDTLMGKFKDESWKTSKAYQGTYTPIAGDLVFFDWIVNGVKDPQHVGVVIAVSDDNEYIFTIEGNSAGIVAVRKYPINDERILGYGVLDWKA